MQLKLPRGQKQGQGDGQGRKEMTSWSRWESKFIIVHDFRIYTKMELVGW